MEVISFEIVCGLLVVKIIIIEFYKVFLDSNGDIKIFVFEVGDEFKLGYIVLILYLLGIIGLLKFIFVFYCYLLGYVVCY